VSRSFWFDFASSLSPLASACSAGRIAVAERSFPRPEVADLRAIDQLRELVDAADPDRAPAAIARPQIDVVPTASSRSGDTASPHPAHWEHRLPDGESYVPPLTGFDAEAGDPVPGRELRG